MPVAEVHGLTVQYGSFTALSDFSVTIPEGCVGLLGPNGAGKSTLIKTILGFVKPASGHASVLGFDIEREGKAIRQKVGLMPEQDCHIPGMTAVQFVAFAGELAGMPSEQAMRRAHEVLEYCGLGEARYRPVETYSTGMKQRIKLAQALVHGPSLLLLDEPTNGLDPRGREEMLNLIQSVSHGKGVNVIVSSHLLKDIERTCDQVVVVSKGNLVAEGLIKDLKKIEGQPIDVELLDASESFLDHAAKLGLHRPVVPPRVVLPAEGQFHNAGEVWTPSEAPPGHYRLQGTGESHELVKLVFQAAQASGSQVRSVQLAERTLEEAFLEVIR